MKLLKFAGTILTVATIALTAPAAQAAVIEHVTNGGFETFTGSFPSGALPKGRFHIVKPTGWTCATCATRPPYTFVGKPGSATSSNGGYAVYAGLPASSPNGGNFIQADGAPSYNAEFSQSIGGLTAGMSYLLTFFQASGQQAGFVGGTTEWWNVTFGSNTTRSSALMTTASGGFQPWAPISMLFTASAPTQVLKFLAMGSPDGLPPTVFLDGVSLVAVPEPSSMAVIGLATFGLGALGARRRARRVAAA